VADDERIRGGLFFHQIEIATTALGIRSHQDSFSCRHQRAWGDSWGLARETTTGA
jgi:hypothetical protein